MFVRAALYSLFAFHAGAIAACNNWIIIAYPLELFDPLLLASSSRLFLFDVRHDEGSHD